MSWVNSHWFTKGFSAYSHNFCAACVTCARYNIGRGTVTLPAAHNPPSRLFQHIMMDYIDLTPSEGKKHCLVIVDMLSKWVEAFPAAKADAGTVVKALIKEIIPRWGIPKYAYRLASHGQRPFP